MTFKLKAWHIYVISIVVLPYPLLMLVAFTATRPTEESFASNIGSAIAYVAVFGGIILAIYYYGNSKTGKKKEPETK